MKTHLRKLLQINSLIILFSITFFLSQTHAQVAQGCDGKRYLDDVFTDTTQTRSVLFGKNGVELYMDVIEPKGDKLTTRPLMVVAFGGGFIQGKRTEQYMLDMCNLYAKKGYVCATIDYRLYNLLNGFPDSTKITQTVIGAVHDMKAAVRYFRKDAAGKNTFRVDTNNIIVGGASAGAITAMHVAMMDSTDALSPWLRDIIMNLGGFEGNSGNPGYSSEVKGALSLSGALYQKEIIDKKDVPFIAYHGSADNIVPFGYGKNVYNFYSDGDSSCVVYAQSLGLKANLSMVPGGGHSDVYDLNGPFASYLRAFVVQSSTFFKQLVCGEPITSSIESVETVPMQLYPNPSNNVIHLQIDDNTEGYRLQIFDVLGREVFKLDNIINGTCEITKQDLGKGLFIAHISNRANNKMSVKKIIFE